jgi:amidohydrolase
VDSIQQRIIERIDKNREEILTFARDIYTHAELGYKETRTASQFAEKLRALQLTKIETGLALTGVKGYLKPHEVSNGPTLSLLGELDALRIPTHPQANPETQAAHCCGHHAQLAGIYGAAIALSDPDVAAALDGNVVFFAVPAEEYGEIAFKNQLREQGKIRYGGGKCELIRIGAFDDIQLNIAHHSSTEGLYVGNGSSNGFVSKVIRFLGRASHAAAAPHRGVNALNAATIGHTALQFQRETFKDEDAVRIHPILTKGGNLVNVVPDEVVLETLVRAKNINAILDASKKTDRAYRAGADAVGAGYIIETLPGYLPQIPTPPHPAILEALKLTVPGKEVRLVDTQNHDPGSTDVGDLQHIQPVLCFGTGGVGGSIHTPGFCITDEDEAYLLTAKLFALAAYALLKNNAEQARSVIDSYTATFTKEQYVSYLDALMTTEKKELVND